MFKENYIEDTLDGIKNIIYYAYDTINYEDYIKQLEGIIAEIDNEQKVCVEEERFARLTKLKQRAEEYLSKAQCFNRHFINQQNEEMGK